MSATRVLLLLSYLVVRGFAGELQELSSSAVSLDHQSIVFDENRQTTRSVLFRNSSSTCSESDESSCPPYLICEDQKCQCRDDYPYGINCSATGIEVLTCHCVTYSAAKELLLFGDCLYNCGKNPLYRRLPDNISDLNDSMCGKIWRRDGALCGRCLPNHYPMAYSYNLTCIECHNIGWNWARYIMAAYMPLTLFYLVLLFFRANITSGYCYAFVTYCQAVTMPFMLRVVILDLALNTDKKFLVGTKILASFFGLWNLDFFRLFYSDICLGIGILPTLALDYAIAVYPLILIEISYFLVVLYYKNYRLIVFMWKPFQRLFSLFGRNWDIRTSILDVFSTFFLLSNMKFLSVSFDLLIFTKVYEFHPNGHNHTLGLYYAADIEYFGSEHLPYAVLALVVLLIFVVLPVTILFCYPFTLFQRFLNLFPIRWHALHTFMDIFQGCYKNGTDPGTRDCRWFSAMYYVFRIICFLVYAFTRNILCFLICGGILLFFSIFVLVVQPFKSSVAYNNNILAIFTQLLALSFIFATGPNLSSIHMPSSTEFFHIISVMLVCTVFLYATLIILVWLAKKKKFSLNLIRRFIAWRKGYDPVINERGSINNSILHSKESMKDVISHAN